jgi:uncharacterized membrane protein
MSIKTLKLNKFTALKISEGWFCNGILGAMVLVYGLVFSQLALARYYKLEAGAMDIGYISQVFYNTAHNQPFRLTVYDPFTAPDPYHNYFFYHAEPILGLLAPFYGWFNVPEALLIFQAFAVALGAFPAFWLAHARIGGVFAGFCFAAAYLLAPALQAATLSDYHNVALAAPLLMAAIYFGWRKQSWLFGLCALLAAATKEDATLVTALLGGYAFLVWRLRWAGGAVALVSLAWFLAVTRLIMPYFGSTGESVMIQRYSQYGANLTEIVGTVLFKPLYVLRTLPMEDILRYLGGLWLQNGLWLIFNPFLVFVAVPTLGANILSSNAWQYSGGAHYSAILVPVFLASSITGLGWLLDANKLSLWLKLAPPYLKKGGLAVVLGGALFYYWLAAIAPLSATPYRASRDTEQTRRWQIAQNFAAKIPPTATVSAQSSLVGLVSQRRTVFLFPRIMNGEEVARFIWLDVTGITYPFEPEKYHAEVQKLLQSEIYGLVAAEEGFLLFEYGKPFTAVLPASFYAFARGNESSVALPQDRKVLTPPGALLAEGELRLRQVGVSVSSETGNPNPPLEVVSFWEVLRPPSKNWQLVYEWEGADYVSKISPTRFEVMPRFTAVTAWLPVGSWQVGQIIRIRDFPVYAGKYRTLKIYWK